MGYLSARACNADVRLGKAGTAGAGGAWKRVRADAAQRRLSLFVGELRAGAALFLAGFSSGRSVGARGGDGGNNSEFGMRNSKLGRGAVLRSDAALSPHFALVLCLIWDSIKIFCTRSRLPHAAQRQAGRLAGGCASVPRGSGAMTGRWRFCWAFELAHTCRAPHSAKQDGLREVAFLFRGGRDRHSCVLTAVWGYLALLVHLGIVRFLWRSRRSSTGVAYTKRSAASGGRFFRYGVLICYDAAGSTLGAEMWKPHCGLSGLSSFDSRRGCALRGEHSAEAQRQRAKATSRFSLSAM